MSLLTVSAGTHTVKCRRNLVNCIGPKSGNHLCLYSPKSDISQSTKNTDTVCSIMCLFTYSFCWYEITLLVAWHSGKKRRSWSANFPCCMLTFSWWVTTYVGKPSAGGQPTRSTQSFILSASINEYWAAIRCSPPRSVEAPSGEHLRGKGRHGVPCRLNCVIHAWVVCT